MNVFCMKSYRMEWACGALALLISSCATLINSDSQICSQIRNYEKAPFAQGQTRRSVTLKWVGGWMDFENGFGKGCLREDDAASVTLCKWLVENTSTEFPQTTPKSILRCYGHRFPRSTNWGSWQSSIDIWGQAEQPILLEVDLKDDRSVRITVFEDGHGTYDNDFIPLIQPKK